MKDIFKNLIIQLAIYLFDKFAAKHIPGGEDYGKDGAGATQGKVYGDTEETKDIMPLGVSSIVTHQNLFLTNLAKLIQYAQTLPGYHITGGELTRPPEMQAIYKRRGLSMTTSSQHLVRLAIDLNVFINGEYQTGREAYKPLADFWVSLDPRNKAGYHWGWDANHFEMKP